MIPKTSPGRIGLTQIHGRVGLGIRVGQWLNRSGFEDYEHAFVDLGDGTLIEAEPGGARIRPIDEYDPAHVWWCDGIYGQVSPDVRLDIAEIARSFKGTKYSFLDYDALALHRLGLDTQWLQDYIGRTDHLICSQLADLAYSKAGQHLFENRWPGFVTPGDLFLLDRSITMSVTRMWGYQRGDQLIDLGEYPV